MSKNAFFIGQPIYSQLISLIPKSLIADVVSDFDSDRYIKKFMTYDHLICMLYCSLMGCESIRELTTGLQASMNRLQHLGLVYTPRRSTISDANKRRSDEVFGSIFHRLVKLYFPVLSDSSTAKRIEDKLFIVDSTTVSLFNQVMRGAGSYKQNGRKKGGAKAHVLLKAKEDVPVFVHLTEGKEHDQVAMGLLPLPKGSFIVFDKAYTNSSILFSWDEKEITWVTRMRNKANIKSISRREVSEQQATLGILNDQMIRLGRRSNRSTKVMLVRLVTYYDKEKNKVFEFLTNNFNITALQVADIYKRRWQIELMFKRWKSNNPLKYFLGDNENAIKIQIWTALIADLLVQVVRVKLRKVKARWSFSNLAGLIKQHLFTDLNLIEFLKNPERTLLQYIEENKPKNQLKLFDTS